MVAGVVVLTLSAPVCSFVEMNGKNSDGLRKDPDASPNRRKAQGAFLSDNDMTGGILEGISRQDFIYRIFEFCGGQVALLRPGFTKKKPPHLFHSFRAKLEGRSTWIVKQCYTLSGIVEYKTEV